MNSLFRLEAGYCIPLREVIPGRTLPPPVKVDVVQ